VPRPPEIPPDIEAVALLGWHVYPASPHSRAACFKDATDAASCDLDRIAAWTRRYAGCNWRVVFGLSGIWGLDCDVPPGHAHDGVAGLAALARVHGGMPPRPVARSGGGGLAVFFSHAAGERVIGTAGYPCPGIDPRRGRQSQTIPPSVHLRTGQPYRWIVPPWQVSPPPAPVWLLRLVEPPPEPVWSPAAATVSGDSGARLLRWAVRNIVQAGDGTRNDTLNRHAFVIGKFIGAGLIAEQQAADALTRAAQEIGVPLPEIRATLRSAFRGGARHPIT
jgi:hypothetical protein